MSVGKTPLSAPAAGGCPVGQAHCGLDGELVDSRKPRDAVVEDVALELCELSGIGSVVAACVLTAWRPVLWMHPAQDRRQGSVDSQ